MKRTLHPATLALAVALTLAPGWASAQQSDLDRCLVALDKAQGAVDRATSRLREVGQCAATTGSGSQPDPKPDPKPQPLADDRLLDLARQRLGDVLANDECGNVQLQAAGPGRIRVTGPTSRLAELRQALQTLRRDFPTLQIDDSGLTQAGPCGDRIDPRWAFAKTGDAYQQVGRTEARTRGGNRVPRAEECEELGAKIEELRSGGRSNLPDRFWVLRRGGNYEQPIYDQCVRQENGTWADVDYNLTGQAPLVLRSGT